MTHDKKYPVDTLDKERTYAADIDMSRDPAEMAKLQSRDTVRAGGSEESAADDSLAAATGQNGQT